MCTSAVFSMLDRNGDDKIRWEELHKSLENELDKSEEELRVTIKKIDAEEFSALYTAVIADDGGDEDMSFSFPWLGTSSPSPLRVFRVLRKPSICRSIISIEILSLGDTSTL
ncbi:Calmodulin-like protein 5 [Striga hermonthica]|uniref:Calmodulin-like protein 5 n=1 Tax=Striga hermonthica TaxID=68872 RepID=A0A9N7RSW0_STRHE|nr:Calmodulin-like protein 5 [Striga hermonthica]